MLNFWVAVCTSWPEVDGNCSTRAVPIRSAQLPNVTHGDLPR